MLITGESGTGKELVARAIYQHSRAGDKPVPGDQLRRDSRDAAGERAVRPREGGVHRGRPPPHRQVRAVQRRHAVPRRDRRHAAGDAGEDACGCCRTRQFERVGGNETIRTDVRVIAATNRDLKALVGGGTVPAGPVLPPRACSPSTCRRCASAATTCRCSCSISCGGSAASSGARCGSVDAGGAGAAAALPVAGERPRAAERAEAGAAAGSREHADSGVPAGLVGRDGEGGEGRAV